MKPLLLWLLEKYPDTPKKRAKQWILAGRVSVNGVVIRKPNQPLPDPQDTLQLLDRQAMTLDCGRDGWQIHPRVNLLYLDAALAVVNKGPGLLSVPAPANELSAQSVLADFLAGKLRGRPVPAAYRQLVPLQVHRLDLYTSGVFCMAMNPVARRCLIEQLQHHTMRREYVAFAEGRPAQPTGTWRNWLKMSADETHQFVVSDAEARQSTDGSIEEAITHYEVLTEYPLPAGRGVVTKLHLQLQTGRRHQIRVQAAHAGLPLVGDRTYNLKFSKIVFDRQALHAERLTLEHPDRPGTPLWWTAPLPPDLQKLEELLRTGRV